MKNASIILNSVLAVAVVVLYVLYFTSKPGSSSSSQSQGTIAPAGSIVYIQIDSLMNQYDMFNDLKSELESKAQVIQDDLSKKGRAFERDYKDWEAKIQKGLVTRAQAETQQQQLAMRQQELQNLSQQKQMEMAEEEEKNFSVIINSSATMNTVLQADSTLNITSDVVAGLNDEYIKTKSKGTK